MPALKSEGSSNHDNYMAALKSEGRQMHIRKYAALIVWN